MEILFVMKISGIVRPIGTCELVIIFGFFLISQSVKADAEPNAGQKTVAIGIRKTSVADIGRQRKGKRIPSDRLFRFSAFQKDRTEVAADLGARRSEAKTFGQRRDGVIALALKAIAGGETAAGADLIGKAPVSFEKGAESRRRAFI